MRILLVTPPMSDLHTPYPATAYLKGFLRTKGHEADQADAGLELILRLLSRPGLRAVAEALRGEYSDGRRRMPANAAYFVENFERYENVLEPTLRFLQGADPSLAFRIAGRKFLPEGPNAAATWAYEHSIAALTLSRALDQASIPARDTLALPFGRLGVQDRAKYLAGLFVADIIEIVRDGLDSRFFLSRYGESLAESSPTFEPIHEALQAEPTLIDRFVDRIAHDYCERFRPELVGLTVPFASSAYGAFRMAKAIRAARPGTRLALGGGYVNTELRSLAEPRVFDYFDFVTLDDGERPLLCLLEHLEGRRPPEKLFRTLVRQDQKVTLVSDPGEHDIPHADCGTPTYEGLRLKSYFPVVERLNSGQRVLARGHWNKLTLAHGCYWKRCAFCDVSLSYVGRYEPSGVDAIIDQIEAMISETGKTGFTFVDEAAPPALLKELSQRLLERELSITWFSNVRFDKAFTPELARLMRAAGCIEVAGGLECATDRLLKLMSKGVSLQQVAQATTAFAKAGIQVHTYLIYGFPGQTEQETVDGLEYVRQLFLNKCIHSAYWHRFTLTPHSPCGLQPEKYGIRALPRPRPTFAEYRIPFEDSTGIDHDKFGPALHRSTHHFVHGVSFEKDVRSWFDFPMPGPGLAADFVATAIAAGSS